MNAYAFVGFVVAFGGSAFYAANTILSVRRVAAKVLAVQAAAAGSKSPSTDGADK